ncbi:unnamed protein product [Peronospora destructor]|uniref:Uncharacterized protein n=1 Tax=Peronospora destructor TaxID=86335 RepID=A0AAV0T5P1_9STRA|nr:unnamed protein product [Peronospora destructor]
MASTRRRNVVLYFDLNRTFVMSDAAGSRTIENAVNYLLSECTWGYVNPLLHSNGFVFQTLRPLNLQLRIISMDYR